MTLETVGAGLLLSLTLYYVLFLFRIRQGLRRLNAPPAHSELRFVSVILPVRNEEANIRRVISDILSQDYPRELYELVIVDDASDDNTVALARSIVGQDRRVVIIELPPHQSIRGGRKPLAIARGINAARGNIILTTDADCTLGPGWIRSMASCFDDRVAFVAGPVLEDGKGGLVSKLSSLEFLGLITTAAGLFGINKPIICNGANIAYRKSVFVEAGGYGGDHQFSDDEVLMQRIAQRGLGRLLFCPAPEALVLTASPATFLDFWNQRTRWASKRNHYENKRILLRLLILYFFFLTLFVSFPAGLFVPAILPVVALCCVLKITSEALTLVQGARFFASRISVPHFLIAQIFHVPYIVFAAILGQVTSLRWKGKTIRR